MGSAEININLGSSEKKWGGHFTILSWICILEDICECTLLLSANNMLPPCDKPFLCLGAVSLLFFSVTLFFLLIWNNYFFKKIIILLSNVNLYIEAFVRATSFFNLKVIDIWMSSVQHNSILQHEASPMLFSLLTVIYALKAFVLVKLQKWVSQCHEVNTFSCWNCLAARYEHTCCFHDILFRSQNLFSS